MIDASESGISGILGHNIGGNYRPFYYFSQSVNNDKNWHSNTLEAYALFTILKKARNYLIHRPYTIYTDNRALVYINEKRSTNRKVARWSDEILDHDFTIIHRPGKLNEAADALSRPGIEPKVKGLESGFDKSCFFISSGSNYDLVQMQKNDYKFGPIYKKLISGENNHTVKNFCLVDGVLMLAIDQKNKQNYSICLPNTLIVEIFKNYHENSLAGAHLGSRKTYHKIKTRYFWKHMRIDITKLIQSCKLCQKRRKSHALYSGKMFLSTANYPLEQITLDHIVVNKASKSKHKYILTAVDRFTGFAFAYPTKTLSALEVCFSDFSDYPDQYHLIRGLPS